MGGKNKQICNPKRSGKKEKGVCGVPYDAGKSEKYGKRIFTAY